MNTPLSIWHVHLSVDSGLVYIFIEFNLGRNSVKYGRCISQSYNHYFTKSIILAAEVNVKPDIEWIWKCIFYFQIGPVRFYLIAPYLDVFPPVILAFARGSNLTGHYRWPCEVLQILTLKSKWQVTLLISYC